MSASTRRDRLVQLIEPVVSEAGFDLEDVVVAPAGRRRLLRVIVDHDNGVSLDDTAALTRTLSGALDASDAMTGGPYVLEVSSPGVDRPLIEPRHWRRAVGRRVRVPVYEHGHERGEVAGRVRDADHDGVVLDVRGTARRFGYDELGRGRVQVDFGGDGTEEGGPWTST